MIIAVGVVLLMVASAMLILIGLAGKWSAFWRSMVFAYYHARIQRYQNHPNALTVIPAIHGVVMSYDPEPGNPMCSFALNDPVREWCSQNMTGIPRIIPPYVAYLDIHQPRYLIFKTQNDAFLFRMRWM
ncbi:MAG: hypothetical protein EOP83_02040 [Verrucomicrobiaceae bacterium]|nr:MAG: hypothetical protein EOP83_02040 [Verrucomicrobiaceae bacterium]